MYIIGCVVVENWVGIGVGGKCIDIFVCGEEYGGWGEDCS